MQKALWVLAIISPTLAACVKPLVNPEPVSAATPLAIPEAVQRITAAVVKEGFEIGLSDPVTGTLVAKRERGPKGNEEFLRCNFAKGSIAETHGVTSLVVSVSIQKRDGGSMVLVGTKTTTSYPTLMTSVLASPPSETACVTNGKAEAIVRSALESDAAAGGRNAP